MDDYNEELIKLNLFFDDKQHKNNKAKLQEKLIILLNIICPIEKDLKRLSKNISIDEMNNE